MPPSIDYAEEQKKQQKLGQELHNPTMYSEILRKIMELSLSRKDIAEAFGKKQISGYLNRTLSKLVEDRLIEHTIPENKNRPEQKSKITKRGIVFLELLKK